MAEQATATVKHPTTGEEATFSYPADNTDSHIRYEHPDGTKGYFENPNGVSEPEVGDDVIWDANSASYVKRVTDSETGTAAEGQ